MTSRRPVPPAPLCARRACRLSSRSLPVLLSPIKTTRASTASTKARIVGCSDRSRRRRLPASCRQWLGAPTPSSSHWHAARKAALRTRGDGSDRRPRTAPRNSASRCSMTSPWPWLLSRRTRSTLASRAKAASSCRPQHHFNECHNVSHGSHGSNGMQRRSAERPLATASTIQREASSDGFAMQAPAKLANASGQTKKAAQDPTRRQ